MVIGCLSASNHNYAGIIRAMAELVHDCPRCGARSITFDVMAAQYLYNEYSWQEWHEVFAICRQCKRSTVFVVCDDVNADHDHTHKVGLLNLEEALNRYIEVKGHINIKDMATARPPAHVPEIIEKVFREAATCIATECYNAAATMFRLCIDLATRDLLPPDRDAEPNAHTRRTLGLRLPWLFDNGKLPESLRELSHCVKEDGNDGAHAGTIEREDAEDLLDFTVVLLDQMYTQPKRVELAAQRREDRRSGADS